MSKVLVTGSSGFVGKALVSRLMLLNYEVVLLNHSNCDVLNFEKVMDIDMSDVTHVYHLAAKTFVPESWEHPEQFYNVNFTGTLNILELCRKHSINLTYVSSYLYGEPDYLPIDESHTLKPNNPYAQSKFLAEQLCEFYRNNYQMNITIIRPFNIYGVNQKDHFLIPYIVKQILDNGIVYVNDLKPKRDYIYIDDLVDALVMSSEKNLNATYNIGSGISYSVQEIIGLIQEITKINVKINCKNIIRKNEVNDVVADIRKAYEDFDWAPKFSLLDGLSNIINEYKK